MPPATPRILIVEDDSIITHLLATMLQKRGYAVAGVVTTGEEAVIKSAELDPDLIIMDVGLAGKMDGLDASHYIFQLFHYPILFVTGCSDEDRISKAKFSQPYGVIFKPFTPIEIATNVDLAIYNHSQRPKSATQYPAGEPGKIKEMLDAVIMTNKQGRIVYFNPTALWYLDIPAKDIYLKHWREVMMFINDKTDEQLKDPVNEAATHMTGVIHESNTAMVTTTSKRRKVRLNIRPLLDNRGQFLAVMISIREKTPKPGVPQ
jgi:DNA-binding response OmpR family regulator